MRAEIAELLSAAIAYGDHLRDDAVTSPDIPGPLVERLQAACRAVAGAAPGNLGDPAALRAALVRCVAALMSTRIAKPEGPAQAEWAEATTRAMLALGEEPEAWQPDPDTPPVPAPIVFKGELAVVGDRGFSIAYLDEEGEHEIRAQAAGVAPLRLAPHLMRRVTVTVTCVPCEPEPERCCCGACIREADA